MMEARDCARRMVARLAAGPMLMVLDRGFPARDLIEQMINHRIDLAVRPFLSAHGAMSGHSAETERRQVVRAGHGQGCDVSWCCWNSGEGDGQDAVPDDLAHHAAILTQELQRPQISPQAETDGLGDRFLAGPQPCEQVLTPCAIQTGPGGQLPRREDGRRHRFSRADGGEALDIDAQAPPAAYGQMHPGAGVAEVELWSLTVQSGLTPAAGGQPHRARVHTQTHRQEASQRRPAGDGAGTIRATAKPGDAGAFAVVEQRQIDGRRFPVEIGRASCRERV